jgi:hypothetical protein
MLIAFGHHGTGLDLHEHERFNARLLVGLHI